MASSALPLFSCVNINEGTIFCLASAPSINCQLTPYLSAHQPYLSFHGYLSSAISTPPSAVNNFHFCSISSSESQKTKKEIEGFILNSGPPFNPINNTPSSSNITTIGFSEMIFDWSKTEE